MQRRKGKLGVLVAAALGLVISLAPAAGAEQKADDKPKAGCTWGGVSTSDGGHHDEYMSTNSDGTKNYRRYECKNGSWEFKGYETYGKPTAPSGPRQQARRGDTAPAKASRRG